MWKVRPGGHRYYLEASPPDGRGPEPPGRWCGRGARSVEALGPVGSGALASLLAGADPLTGAPLGADRSRVTVAAFDLTFCAPKSVSLLHALGDPEISDAVGRGHERAVAEALGYVETRAMAVRRAVPEVGRVPQPTEPAPVAVFLHRTSRALDPHLHSHVVVANVGLGPDGQWSALDGRGIYAHRAAAGALYHAQLRHELTAALGVAWSPPQRGRAEIRGVGEQARAEFSQRAAAITAHLAARGLATEEGKTTRRRAAVTAATVTRPHKDLSTSADELRPWWRQRAAAVGLGPLRIEAVMDRSPGRRLVQDAGRGHEEHERRAAVVALAGAVSSRETLARRDVVHAWASSLAGGEEVRVIEERVDRFLGAGQDRPAGQDHPDEQDRPGVAERRLRLEQLLEARGMSPEWARSIEHSGPELGLW